MLGQANDADVHGAAVVREHGRLYLNLRAVGLEGGMDVVAGGSLMACREQDALTGVAVDKP